MLAEPPNHLFHFLLCLSHELQVVSIYQCYEVLSFYHYTSNVPTSRTVLYVYINREDIGYSWRNPLPVENFVRSFSFSLTLFISQYIISIACMLCLLLSYASTFLQPRPFPPCHTPPSCPLTYMYIFPPSPVCSLCNSQFSKNKLSAVIYLF